MVDKDLFLYDLSVVTIMKSEAPYVKEWLDYHLLAGVDHFFIYDNESPDNLKEILQPYIDAGIVTYTFYPGKCRQLEAYADAAKRFRFFSRYMTWIDADEFIFPKSKPTIPEVVDEIFTEFPNAAGLAVNIHVYGSNGQDKADLNRGVLERFTRHASNDWTPPVSWRPELKGGTATVSSIADPRKVRLFVTPHAAVYFDGCNAIGEKGNTVLEFSSYPVSTEKIVMNHYSYKSREEYAIKVQRGNADHADNKYTMDSFSHDNCNEEFDDGILRYRNYRAYTLGLKENSNVIFPLKRIDYSMLVNTLNKNLLPAVVNIIEPTFFDHKIDNFLTCLNLSSFLKGRFLDEDGARLFEELSLIALYKATNAIMSLPEISLLIDEIPNILTLPYPVVENIRLRTMGVIQQIMDAYRRQNHWYGFAGLEHNLKFLKNFDTVTKK